MTQASSIVDYPAPRIGDGNWLTQTYALLLDAYRDLQSRKLFWLTLILTLIVPLLFGSVGLNPQGISIFGKQLRGVPFNSVLIPVGDFYKYIFTALAIPLWLGVLSTILALIGVGGLFPDVLSSGSIDLYLSRPIGRLRLFATKYLFGLLFTALQVFIFCLVSFVVIGLRGGVWETGIFLAVPLVTLFFSYLYCVCVLVGILTRSALAAILLTLIFWGLLFAVHNTDMVLSTFNAAAEYRVNQQKQLIAANDRIISHNESLPPERQSNVSAFVFQRDAQTEKLADFEAAAMSLQWWRDLVLAIKAPLPKTNETVALMSRWLVRPGMMDQVEQADRESRSRRGQRGGPSTRPRENLNQLLGVDEVQDSVEREFGARDLPWIIGTSLGFEIVILSIAAWIFYRRDF